MDVENSNELIKYKEKTYSKAQFMLESGIPIQYCDSTPQYVFAYKKREIVKDSKESDCKGNCEKCGKEGCEGECEKDNNKENDPKSKCKECGKEGCNGECKKNKNKRGNGKKNDNKGDDSNENGNEDEGENSQEEGENEQGNSNEQLSQKDSTDNETDEKSKRAKSLFGDLLKRNGESKRAGTNVPYAVKAESGKVSEVIIISLIQRFLDEKFLIIDTDLNVRGIGANRKEGNENWNYYELMKDKLSKDYQKMQVDRYKYSYENGVQENIPFSFYFDLSLSMEKYSELLSIIAVELVKRDVRILIGTNQEVEMQLNKVPKEFNIEKFKKLLSQSGKEKYCKDNKIEFALINEDLDTYLIRKKAEKVAVFSDFDPAKNVINLSKSAGVYWFSFEERYNDLEKIWSYKGMTLDDFKGKYYKTKTEEDLIRHFINMHSRSYEMKQRRLQYENVR